MCNPGRPGGLLHVSCLCGDDARAVQVLLSIGAFADRTHARRTHGSSVLHAQGAVVLQLMKGLFE